MSIGSQESEERLKKHSRKVYHLPGKPMFLIKISANVFYMSVCHYC